MFRKTVLSFTTLFSRNAPRQKVGTIRRQYWQTPLHVHTSHFNTKPISLETDRTTEHEYKFCGILTAAAATAICSDGMDY